MINKIASLYKRGLLNGPEFTNVVRNIAVRHIEKTAGDKIKLPSSVESFETLKKLVKNTHDTDKLFEIGDRIKNFEADITDGVKFNEAFEKARSEASKYGHTFDPFAKKRLGDTILKRIDELSQSPKNLKDAIKRWGSKAGVKAYIPAIGALGLAGLGLGEYAYGKYQDYKSNNMLNDILAKNPDLNIEKARENFSAFRTVSPRLSRNRAIVKNYLRRMNQFDNLDLAPLQMAADIHSKRYGDSAKAKWKAHEVMTRPLLGMAGTLGM